MNKNFFDQNCIYEFECNSFEFESINNYCSDISWGKSKNRIGFNKFKGGKTYIGKNFSLKEEKPLLGLHQWMESCLNKVKEDIKFYKNNCYELVISQSWVNCSFKGDVHHRHNHNLSLLSGILYLTEPSQTIFFNRSIYYEPLLFTKEETENKFVYQGKKGNLIIFPSTLEHCVGPHFFDSPRMTLSFNSWFKGDFGDPNSCIFLSNKNII